MRDTYGIEISRQQQQLLTAWAHQDPVDEWELERNRRIAAVQGTANAYVGEVAIHKHQHYCQQRPLCLCDRKAAPALAVQFVRLAAPWRHAKRQCST
jgi:hypothetical protein